ncbi:hypothetical protein FRB93_013084 [Tulasnella sp. JGI-2019a]|nr:hypothetical protein FRB93_013084 [Tulasnella sp. JGI-2019a]
MARIYILFVFGCGGSDLEDLLAISKHLGVAFGDCLLERLRLLSTMMPLNNYLPPRYLFQLFLDDSVIRSHWHEAFAFSSHNYPYSVARIASNIEPVHTHELLSAHMI